MKKGQEWTKETFARERAQSLFMSIEISDTYIFICGRTSTHMRMLNNSLLVNDDKSLY